MVRTAESALYVATTATAARSISGDGRRAAADDHDRGRPGRAHQLTARGALLSQSQRQLSPPSPRGPDTMPSSGVPLTRVRGDIQRLEMYVACKKLRSPVARAQLADGTSSTRRWHELRLPVARAHFAVPPPQWRQWGVGPKL